jgi:hypothetical protein
MTKLAQAHASLEFDWAASRWTKSLRSKSGDAIGFQARSLLMIVLLSAARLVTAPFRSATRVCNWESAA